MFGFESLFAYLVPIVAPLVVSGVKKYGPSIPKALLPLASVAIGTAIGFVTDLGMQAGAVGGAVGVFVREVFDQSKKMLSEDRVPMSDDKSSPASKTH